MTTLGNNRAPCRSRLPFEERRLLRKRRPRYAMRTFALFVALWPLPLLAQGRPDPSDLELSAAYCLSYTQSFRNWFAAQGSSDPAVRKIEAEAQAETDNQIARLRAYIFAHGASDNPRPFSIAFARGERDAQECQTADDSVCNQQCSKPCQPSQQFSKDACIACIRACPKPPACQRGAKCTDVEAALPF